jgi:hypothetical protein
MTLSISKNHNDKHSRGRKSGDQAKQNQIELHHSVGVFHTHPQSIRIAITTEIAIPAMRMASSVLNIPSIMASCKVVVFQAR